MKALARKGIFHSETTEWWLASDHPTAIASIFKKTTRSNTGPRRLASTRTSSERQLKPLVRPPKLSAAN